MEQQRKANPVRQFADFFIRVVMMLVVCISLLYFSNALDKIELLILFYFYIAAIIVKGVASFF